MLQKIDLGRRPLVFPIKIQSEMQYRFLNGLCLLGHGGEDI